MEYIIEILISPYDPSLAIVETYVQLNFLTMSAKAIACKK